MRQSGTEELRQDVKQIMLSPEALMLVDKQSILEQRPNGKEVAIIVEGAEEVLTKLQREGAEHRVIELNLDEIFEAYVTGQGDTESNSAFEPISVST